MANKSISQLTAAVNGSLAGANVFPGVQTTGIGPVKVSFTQLTNYILSGGTGVTAAGGVSGGNVGIGTASPGTLLELSKAVSNNIGPEIRLRNDAGTFLSGSRISFYDGLYERASIVMQVEAAAATGNMQFYTGFNPSTEKMRITGAGNVGIGTTSPSSTLNVVSPAACRITLKGGNTAAQSSAVYFTAAGSADTLGAIGDQTAIIGGAPDQIFSIYAGANSSAFVPLTFIVGNNERMRITSGGNVGIGTTSPACLLHIEGSSTGQAISFRAKNTNATGADKYIEMFAGGQSTGVSAWNNSGVVEAAVGANLCLSAYNGTMIFQTGTSRTERMRIDSAGLVGIGTASLTYPFEVSASSNATIRLTLAASHNVTLNAIGGGAFTIGLDGSGGTTERMRITSAGNVLIGTTSSPTTGTQCLTIETETAPTATPADTVTFYSSDLSAGNTMPSFYTEGTIVGTGTPTADRTIAVRINGTVYYLLASTIP